MGNDGRELFRRYDSVLEAVEDLPVETALEILNRVSAELRRHRAAGVETVVALRPGRHEHFRGFRGDGPKGAA